VDSRLGAIKLLCIQPAWSQLIQYWNGIEPLLTQKKLLIFSLQLLLALPLGLIFSGLNVGRISWLFAGMASGVLVLQICRIFYHHVAKPNRLARKVGLTLVGLTIGFSISSQHLAPIGTDLPVFTLLTFFMLLSGSVIGYIYSRFSQINILTAMLATVPGGIGIMSSLAADYGKNVHLVSLVQVMRVTSVILLIPFLAKASLTHSSDGVIRPNIASWRSFELSELGLLILALLASALGVALANRIRVPAAEFFGAIAVGMAFNPCLSVLPGVSELHFNPPLWLNVAGQILLGITVGEYWGEKPRLQTQEIVYACFSVAMTLAAGFLTATLAMHLTSWDWLTCLLVTAPGGAPEMILAALTLHHNVETVTAGHLVRLMAINGSLPIWVLLFRHFESREDEQINSNLPSQVL
jgi:uncharacterized protein